VAGAAMWGMSLLMQLLHAPALLAAVLITIVPSVLSGFLHLDGFMDVSDAVLSRRDAETRRKILKDPHTGSFAVIALLLVLFAGVGAMSGEVERQESLLYLVGVPVLSRSAAGLLLLRWKTMPGSSLGAYFKQGAGAGAYILLGAFAASAIALLAWQRPWALFGAAAGILWAMGAARNLGGVNGDVAGFTITITEMLCIVAAALGG